MSHPPACKTPTAGRRMLIAQVAAWLVAMLIVVPAEVRRFIDETGQGADPVAWFIDINIDTTPYLLLLIVAPLFWIVRRPIFTARTSGRRLLERCFDTIDRSNRPAAGRQTRVALILAMTVGAVSLAAAGWVASRPVANSMDRFGDLPPAFHDEYSYLFQAQTFLAGRTWFPSHPAMPRLFDQMHVLNEGRFASRYFPGNGAWLAPFLAAGHPYWGHWLAAALAAMLTFAAGRELGGNGVGLLAGLLTAVAPGMALFSNLLLAHMPTLAGLMLFLWMFLRLIRTGWWVDGLIAGCGLTFAMLCRPMTAAGFGLPFGLWLVWRLLAHRTVATRDGVSLRSQLVAAIAVGAPVLAGLVMLAGYNKAITGQWFTTPYQLYTDIYTPRHVYGFNNVVRGEQRLGPRVLENYDRWAVNLTPGLAARNVIYRTLASLQWTLGVVPLVMAAIVFLAGRTGDRRWWFIVAGVVSLHLVHVPYWYDGIMHWHYVFETAPLLMLMFASATGSLLQCWNEGRRPWMPFWWSAATAAALVVAYVPVDLLWNQTRIRAGIDEIGYSRRKYDNFRETIERLVHDRPALVLVEADPADRHIDYVTNRPALDEDVLFGRFDPQSMRLGEIAAAFPERRLFVYVARDNRLIRLEPAGGRDE